MARAAQDRPIILVGAGIGGLTAALALQQSGQRVSVLEQAASLGEIGAGLTLTPNASRVLLHLGLGDVLADLGVVPDRGAVLDYRDGTELVSMERGDVSLRRHGAPYCQIHRADLHLALAAAVQANDGGCIRLHQRLTGLGQDADGVTAVFNEHSVVTGSLLVGCDGIHSAVRSQLFGNDEPRFTGYSAWRGLVPVEALPAGLIAPDSAVWIGPGRYLARYLVCRGRVLNYVAVARTSKWSEEGWTVRSTPAEVLAEFSDFAPEARTILAATAADECYRWGIFDRDPLPRWTQGRVTLLGDAAHPTTPFLGQGAAMALEDAMVLARAVAAGGISPSSLARYEAARLERTSAVTLESRDNGHHLTSCDPDQYDLSVHHDAETLGLAAYDAVTVPV